MAFGWKTAKPETLVWFRCCEAYYVACGSVSYSAELKFANIAQEIVFQIASFSSKVKSLSFQLYEVLKVPRNHSWSVNF